MVVLIFYEQNVVLDAGALERIGGCPVAGGKMLPMVPVARMEELAQPKHATLWVRRRFTSVGRRSSRTS